MDYILVYRPYNIKRLVEDATKRGGSRGEDEAKDFMYAVNERVSKGYAMKNSGCVVSGDNVIFWALMEKTKAP
jgi:hypothetical protein